VWESLVMELSSDDRERLEGMARSRNLAARLVQRASMILLTAEGRSQREIGEILGCNFKTVGEWQRRWLAAGFEGIEIEKPGRGRKAWVVPSVGPEVIRKTIEETPEQGTHWSTRRMAKVMGIGATTVRTIWIQHGLKPHRIESFKLSNDPRFEEKLVDIVGLYLNPPEHAIVLSVDEKSQIQALDRTQPGLPMKKGRCGTMTHDYKRHGTTTLFAALNTLDGTVISETMARHRHTEWLRFMKKLHRETPKNLALHIICDNYATHKHPAVKEWMEAHKRVQVHFTPTSASWLNMVERFFRDITENRIRRGVFRSVAELETAIHGYIQRHNQNPKPFVWTAKAKDILAKVLRARTAIIDPVISRDLH
jgi:transposase